jgi:GMP reductase
MCNKSDNIFGSIGLYDYDGAIKLYDNGFKNICIDVANGYLSSVYTFAKKLSQRNFFKKIIVGNVHSDEGIFNYNGLVKNTNVMVRVGIGGGSMCLTTLSATGFGRGAITEISETKNESRKPFYHNNMKIIADGGIKTPSHAVKAFGAGADYVMMGGYFSVADVAENIVTGRFMNWGCASDYNQSLYGEKRRHSEGTTKQIDQKDVKSLEDLVFELWGGISSGVSYSGYKSLTDFIGNGIFEVKN